MTRKREIGLALVTCLCVVACVRKPVTAPRAVVPETVPSAILGAAQGGAAGAGKGAAIGAGIGVAVGAVAGFYESKSKTEREIIDQIGGLYLGAQISKPAIPVSGFVFFPEAQYVGVSVIAVEQPGGVVREVYGP